MSTLSPGSAPGPVPSSWWGPAVRAVRARRRVWLLHWGAVVVAALVVALLLPNWYLASTSILPPSSDSDLQASFSSLLRGADLARSALPRTTTPEDVYSAVLGSRTIARAAVRRFGLQQAYGAKTEGEALRRFRRHASVGTTPQGILVLNVEDRSPRRAADVANFMVAQLDSFNRELRMSSGHSARVFVERRLADTREELARVEDSLKALGVSRAVPVTGGAEAGEAGAGLMAQRIAAEVRLETLLQSQAEGSEDVRRVRAELAALDRELRGLPREGTAVARLLREVKIQEQVYALLNAQYEEARVREHKDTPTVQVLDRADVPDQKERPHRGLLVMGAALFGLFESTLWVLYLERRSRA